MAQQNAFEYFDSVNKFATENQSNKTKQQNAVDWLIENLSNKHIGFEMYVNSNKEIIEQAKAMEKGQIMSAYDLGNQNQYNKICISNYVNIDEEQYYNETYSDGKKN